jgi:hypothetical protein
MMWSFVCFRHPDSRNSCSLCVDASIHIKVQVTMGDPPDKSTEDMFAMFQASAIQLGNSKARDITTRDGIARATLREMLSTTTASLTQRPLGSLINEVSDENTIIDSAGSNSPIPVDETTNAQPASEESTAESPAASTNTTSRFLKLPGELRNRIYRIYFEDFEEQMSRRFVYNPSRMTPTYLALLHINRKVRSEAGSIFWKEIAPFHCFPCPPDQPLEAVMLTRIRDVCSLMSIRDVRLPVSIRCTPSWKDPRWDRHHRDETWRFREMVAHTCSLLEHLGRNAGPITFANQQRNKSLDVKANGRAPDGTYERHFGANFLVKCRDQRMREGEHFLLIEGPLAELNWSRDKNGRWSF